MKTARVFLLLLLVIPVALWRFEITLVSHRLNAQGHRAEADYTVMADPFGILEYRGTKLLLGHYSLTLANILGCTIWLALAIGIWALIFNLLSKVSAGKRG
jgi:hypothetical protein